MANIGEIMSNLDWVIIAVVVLSLGVGLFRGFVREVFALLGWIIAGIVATHFAGDMARLLPDVVPGPELRWIVGFILVFFVMLLLGGFTALFVSRLTRAAGLGVSNRLLGALFGFARGVAVLVLIVLLAGLTSLPSDPRWRSSYFSKPLESVALAMRPLLPDSIADRVKYRE